MSICQDCTCAAAAAAGESAANPRSNGVSFIITYAKIQFYRRRDGEQSEEIIAWGGTVSPGADYRNYASSARSKLEAQEHGLAFVTAAEALVKEPPRDNPRPLLVWKSYVARVYTQGRYIMPHTCTAPRSVGIFAVQSIVNGAQYGVRERANNPFSISRLSQPSRGDARRRGGTGRRAIRTWLCGFSLQAPSEFPRYFTGIN